MLRWPLGDTRDAMRTIVGMWTALLLIRCLLLIGKSCTRWFASAVMSTPRGEIAIEKQLPDFHQSTGQCHDHDYEFNYEDCGDSGEGGYNGYNDDSRSLKRLIMLMMAAVVIDRDDFANDDGGAGDEDW